MFRRLHRERPTGPINSMARLQLSLHQHGASITIAVELATRANAHELAHLQTRIAEEMREVKEIVHEATNVHRQALHFPRVIISAREEFINARKEQRNVNWSNISRDDASVKTSDWYQEVETPRTSPGPQKWWWDVRRAMEKREAATVESEAAKAQPALTKRKRHEKDESRTASGMDVDEQSDTEGERAKRRKEKGKGKASPTDADVDMIDGEVDGGPSGLADDNDKARMVKRKERVVNERTLTPADDLTMQPGQTSCTRCLRLGRKCSAVPGAVCTSCHKSKVSCPLFKGGRRSSSRATSRPMSVAPGVMPSAEPGPSSPITALPSPTPTSPPHSTTFGSPSAMSTASTSKLPTEDNSRAPPPLWDEEETHSGPYRRVTTRFLAAMGASAYKPPETTPGLKPTKRHPTRADNEEKAVKTSRRGRSLSRAPARTPRVLSTPARPQEKLVLRIPARSGSGATFHAPVSSQWAPRSSAPASNGRMERDPSAGPSAGSSNRRRERVFVDIPRIDSLEEYSPLLKGDTSTVPTSVATKMAQMETELTALQRAHEALRKYVLSVLPPPHSAADTVAHPTTNSLPHITADFFPRPTADGLTQPRPQTDGLGQALTDHSTSAHDDEVAEMAPMHIVVALANVEVGMAPTDVEMVPAGDIPAPATAEVPLANLPMESAPADRKQDADMDGEQADTGVSTSAAAGGAHLGSLEDGEIAEVHISRKYVLSVLPSPHSAADTVAHPTTNSLPHITADFFPRPTADGLTQPRPQTDGLGMAPKDPSTSTHHDEVAEIAPVNVEVALVNVEVGIAPTDVEMVPADDIIAPATAEEPQADLPMELAPADDKQQPSVEQADVTAAAPNLDVEQQQEDQNTGIAVEEVGAACERRPADVDRDGGQADTGVGMSAAAGGAHLGSLEDGEISEF